MKNTIFIATYFNNPHFIKIQYNSFKNYVKDEWDFAIIDDAADNTTSLLSNRNAEEEIKEECSKYNVRHIKPPQSIHGFKDQGGLMDRQDSLGDVWHPTEKHHCLLRWIFDNHKSLGFDQYKTLVLLDADMFFKQSINISEYMENYDFIGSHREQVITTDHLTGTISEDIQSVAGKKINFFTLCLLFVNMQTVNNLETFDNRSYLRITDTGGKSHKWIENNPQYKYLYLGDMNSQEYRVDFFFKEDRPYSEEMAEIIHYRGGSCWDHQSKEYYTEKLNRMLKRYLPDLYSTEFDLKIDRDLHDRNGYHTFKKQL